MVSEFIPTRARFEKSARSWFRWYAFWLYTHYITGLLIVIIAVLIASPINEGLSHHILGIISGILAASVTFLRPYEKAAMFRTRWHALNSILLDPENDDLSKVYKAYVSSEALTTAAIIQTSDTKVSDGAIR